MAIDKIKSQIRTYLYKFFSKSNLNDDDNIFETGFVNSLFAMQLIMFVEKEFGIKVSNQDLDLKNFSSVNAIVSLIESKRLDN